MSSSNSPPATPSVPSPLSALQPVAVVTGSTSGIGQATALAFAKRGYFVVVHGRSNLAGAMATCDAIEKQALAHLDRREEMQSRGNEQVTAPKSAILLADISDRDAACNMVTAAFGMRGYVDAWIHCAGADVLTGDARDWSFSQKLERLWKTDVEGVIRLSRLVGTAMKKQEPRPHAPCMIHLSWDQAARGFEGDSGQYFCATKAAVEAFSKSLAMTIAPEVRVNCVAPGWIKTDWGNQTVADWQSRAIGESQLARWGTPDDVANVIASICSPECGYIQGQTIAVNGGWKSMYLSPICPSTEQF